MILLQSGCKCSEPKVFPPNWKSKDAPLSVDWFIHYRFYSPDAKPKQVVLKGMNRFKTLKERQAIAQALIDNELQMLREQGYNPITKTVREEGEPFTPHSLFLDALQAAFDRINVEGSTKTGIEFTVNRIANTVKGTEAEFLTVKEVSRARLKTILSKAAVSNDQFNKLRGYLMILYNEFVEAEVFENNIVEGIKKRKTVKKIRETLTTEQRRKVDEHLFKTNRAFWRYLHIFFHSGARSTELLKLKARDVDLEAQRFKVVTKKGETFKEVFKTIKTIALPLWTELMQGAKPDDFVFSEGLVPGAKFIRPDQITKRWYRNVKKKLNVSADFYSLKHTNISEIVNLLTAEDAAKVASHSSTAMVVNIYDVDRETRQHERIKGIKNSFSPS